MNSFFSTLIILIGFRVLFVSSETQKAPLISEVVQIENGLVKGIFNESSGNYII